MVPTSADDVTVPAAINGCSGGALFVARTINVSAGGSLEADEIDAAQVTVTGALRATTLTLRGAGDSALGAANLTTVRLRPTSAEAWRVTLPTRAISELLLQSGAPDAAPVTIVPRALVIQLNVGGGGDLTQYAFANPIDVSNVATIGSGPTRVAGTIRFTSTATFGGTGATLDRLENSGGGPWDFDVQATPPTRHVDQLLLSNGGTASFRGTDAVFVANNVTVDATAVVFDETMTLRVFGSTAVFSGGGIFVTDLESSGDFVVDFGSPTRVSTLSLFARPQGGTVNINAVAGSVTDVVATCACLEGACDDFSETNWSLSRDHRFQSLRLVPDEDLARRRRLLLRHRRQLGPPRGPRPHR